MIHAIYMAAGNSRRFGSNKLLYPYQGKPLYRHGLDLLLELKKEMGPKLSVTVVTQYPEILMEVQTLFRNSGMGELKSVFCEDSKKGASYTIKAGIEAVKRTLAAEGESDYLMFLVADQPHLTLESVRKLIEAAGSFRGTAFLETLSLRCNGTLGNPCMFREDLIPELLTLTEDQGGRKILKRHFCQYVDILDEKELEDVDDLHFFEKKKERVALLQDT